MVTVTEAPETASTPTHAPQGLSAPGWLGNSRVGPTDAHGSATWLITFTDLVALLLAFFVMLFAMSKVDFRKWQNLTDALARGLNTVGQESSVAPLYNLDVDVAELTAGQDLDYLAGVLRQQLAAQPSFAEGAITRHADRLVISMPAVAYAADVDAGVTRGDSALFFIAGVLRQLRNKIEVVAYADARETSGDDLSHWELSLSRGLAAAERLWEAGYERDVIVRGRSRIRTQDGPPEGPARDRGEAAGRVDLVVRLDAAERR